MSILPTMAPQGAKSSWSSNQRRVAVRSWLGATRRHCGLLELSLVTVLVSSDPHAILLYLDRDRFDLADWARGLGS